MDNTVTTIEVSVKNMPEEMKDLFVRAIDLMMDVNSLNFTKNVKVVTTVEVSIENMPEDKKDLLVKVIELMMAAGNLKFTKSVEVETVEQIVSDMEVFNGQG